MKAEEKPIVLEPWKNKRFRSKKWVCPNCATVVNMGVAVKLHREVCRNGKRASVQTARAVGQ